MSILHRLDRTRILTLARRIAGCMDRACDVSSQDARDYDAMRRAISTQAKGHRRFAPAGWRHLCSVEQEVDYFICAVVHEGRGAPERKLSEYSGVREDYLKGALLMCRPLLVERFDRLAAELAGHYHEAGCELLSPCELVRIVREVDYCALSGTATKLDPETLRAAEFCRKECRSEAT
jgi:hypothetical protein